MNRSNGLSRVRTEYESAEARQDRERREQENAVSLKSIRVQRKRLKKKYRGAHWIGGKLYVNNGRGWWDEVPGVPPLPKPSMQAIGLHAGDGPPLVQMPVESASRLPIRPHWDEDDWPRSDTTNVRNRDLHDRGWRRGLGIYS